MPRFDYTAIDKSNRTTNGTLEAANAATARTTLQRQGLRPVSIKAAGKKGAIKIPFIGGGKIKGRDMVVFTRQLATMINAGVPLVRSLNTLVDQTESPALKEHVIVRQHLQGPIC